MFKIETFVGIIRAPQTDGWWRGDQLYRSEERALNAIREHGRAEVEAAANRMSRRVVPV